jgi:hypothetical protein
MKKSPTFPLRLAAVLATGAALSMLPTHADSLELLWQVLPGERSYMTTGNTERGVAFNPVTGHVLVMSRAGGLHLWVLDGQTGAELYEMNVDTSIVSGGTFAANLVGVGEDGAVYVGNLSTSTSAPNFKLYRWENDDASTAPTLAFEGDPAGGASIQRWGDTFDVRGGGANTQVLIGSRASANVAILTTDDGLTFTSHFITGAAGASGSLGVAFGEGNTIWTKVGGNPLLHAGFDLAAGAGNILHSFSTTVVPSTMAPIAVDPAHKQLAGVLYSTTTTTPQSVYFYDIADLGNPPIQLDKKDFATMNANGNGTGAADFGPDLVIALDTNNGLYAYRIKRGAANEPPTLTTQPADVTVLEGGTAQFGVGATGTKPFAYQWRYNEANILDATNASLTLLKVQPAQAGTYSVVVTNIAGSITSSNVTLTVIPLVKSENLTPLWRLAPGEKNWLNTDHSQRGLAFNPQSGRVLVVSRTEGAKIYVLDGASGQELHTLNTDPTVIFGGTFALNLVGAGADGAVYACNLTTDGTATTLNLYRWENDGPDALPTLAYSADPGDGAANRWGDTLSVRGGGVDTQVLLGSRNGQAVALLTTTDGANFASVKFDVNDAEAGSFGLGVAFGAGDTFWGKATGRGLVHVGFDLAAGTATTLHAYAVPSFPGTVAGIALDPSNQFLAGLALENPDNIRLYDISDLSNPPVLLDQEFCAADNENLNGTGALAFGGERLFALDSNNGIVTFTVKKVLPPQRPQLSGPNVAEGKFEVTLTGEAGRTYTLEATADFQSWTTVATQSATQSVIMFSVPLDGSWFRFYRASVNP